MIGNTSKKIVTVQGGGCQAASRSRRLGWAIIIAQVLLIGSKGETQQKLWKYSRKLLGFLASIQPTSLLIYAKSDQTDIPAQQIQDIINKFDNF